MKLNAQYWTARYQNTDIPWDVGAPATPFVHWFGKQYLSKDTSILIPGAGNAYEAFWLADQGFTQVHVLDWSNAIIQKLQEKEGAHRLHFHAQDFFQHTGKYDLILEQTFFCALHPSLRPSYFHSMQQLLAMEGKLVGVFFKNAKVDGPPFHCSESDLREGFDSHFRLNCFETCRQSIPPRKGNEWWVIAEKKEAS